MSPAKKEELRRPKLGYALSGGAVRGAAHLGFLSVFEEAGIRPDLIAGTSAGAIVGAGYAAGLSVEQMSERVEASTWRQVTGSPRVPTLSVFDTTPLHKWLGGVLGDVEFEDLHVPLAAVTCNIVDGTMVVLRTGRVVDAVVASSAIPGLFAPLERDGMFLVDGGVVNNLPVDVAKTIGADVVIAVDVSPLREVRKPENLRDVLTSTVSIMSSGRQLESRRQADYLVVPDTATFSTWDFGRVQEIIHAGRTAALTVVPEVLALLKGYEGA
ncbi:MAG: patatin-like phospholipase family protein [Coriobacteriia bacterium]|jgi:NTE family protein|nr:patatin-like phospholipase family protein [Coriobacteriia bacterium]